MWFKKKEDFVKKTPLEVEIDIQSLPICAIDRDGDETVFILKDDHLDDIYLECSVEQHNSFLNRFRSKLGLISKTVIMLVLSGFFTTAGAIFLTGCEKNPNYTPPTESWVGQYLKGEHELYALTQGENIVGEVNGGLFLFIGGFNGQTKTENIVKFIWKNNNGEYIPSVLPYSKVRFVLTDTLVNTNNASWNPSVKFRWKSSNFDGDPMSSVVYAVFNIKKTQIVSDIHFSLNP